MRKRVLSLALIPLLLFYAIPVGAAEKEQRTWKDEIVYSLMIDRFFDGNTQNNGDADVNDSFQLLMVGISKVSRRS